ncbi:MAG: hypothetical protein H8E94_05515 [Alphaproteobacteria bacterium]|nr:hypothetical protein [Alphaproteobacteria bacterium]
MFKRIAKAFGKKKKPPRKAARKSAPGEGIRQLAAALPETGDAPAQQSGPATPPPPPEPSREDLISEAMRIRSEKAEMLNDLPARDRAKLRKLAEKMLLGGVGDEDADGNGGEKPGTPPRTRH